MNDTNAILNISAWCWLDLLSPAFAPSLLVFTYLPNTDGQDWPHVCSKCTSLLHVYSTSMDDWWFHESKERNDRRTRQEMEYFCHWWLASWKFGPSSNYLKSSCLLVLCLSLRQFIEITCGPHTGCRAVYCAQRNVTDRTWERVGSGSWNKPRPGPMHYGNLGGHQHI